MASGTVQDPAQLIPRVLGRYSPVSVERGEGCCVQDRNGDRWLDFTAGIGVMNTGRCHPKVVAAIREQASKIMHAQANIFLHTPMLEAADRLTGIAPDIMTSAKGLASGMMVCAIASSKEIMDAWAPGAHGTTYGGNAVGIAAAVATFDMSKDEHNEAGNGAPDGAPLH